MACRLIALSAAAVAMLVAGGAHAKVIEEQIELPVEVADTRGQVFRSKIKVTVFRDDARARSPFLILNHGRSSDPKTRAAVRPSQYAANARWLVGLGYTVFFPVRLGYGATAGPNVENSGPCDDKNYAPVYEASVKQSLAVIEHAKSLPAIDPDRGVVMGLSFGGTTAIALAARNVPGVLGALNFAGGGGGRPDTHPGQPCGIERMTELLASYGATARIPTLWLYSVNDQYWGTALPRMWLQAFIARGGIGRLVELPAYKNDGHPIFTGNPAAWQPEVEAFLRRCCAPASGAAGQKPTGVSPTAVFEPFTQAVSGWALKHKVARAVIVVRREGRTVHTASVGGGDPRSPVLLASLSKAITGACVATLVRDGRLALDWPLSRALAKFFAAHGRPADARFGKATIADLLTHRGGFPSARDGEDTSTRSVLDAYLGQHSIRQAPLPAYLALLLERRLLRDPGAAYAYSNGNYLALGAVIEEASGQSYESYCREAVLVPAGATGGLDPTWTVMGAYGGWRMRGEDYLRFFDTLDPAKATYGGPVRDWMLDSKGKLLRATGGSDWYGLGVLLRNSEDGVEIWHTGSWRRRLDPDTVGARSIETSTLAHRAPDGTSWFVHSTPLVLDGARAELARALVEANRSTRRGRDQR